MQVCTSLQTDKYTTTPPLSFFTSRMPFPPLNQQRQSTEGNEIIQQKFRHRKGIKMKHKTVIISSQTLPNQQRQRPKSLAENHRNHYSKSYSVSSDRYRWICNGKGSWVMSGKISRSSDTIRRWWRTAARQSPRRVSGRLEIVLTATRNRSMSSVLPGRFSQYSSRNCHPALTRNEAARSSPCQVSQHSGELRTVCL